MNIENIIDYVNETPHNTNIGILRNKLELYNKEITKGTVKSVNGILPDEAGNVAIAYDDLEGKPFGEEVEENILLVANSNELAGKSSKFAKYVEINNSIFKREYRSSTQPMAYDVFGNLALFSNTNIKNETLGNGSITGDDTGEPFCFVCEAGDDSIVAYYIDGIEDTEVKFFNKTTTLKQLDPKFLPDEVVTEEELSAALGDINSVLDAINGEVI